MGSTVKRKSSPKLIELKEHSGEILRLLLESIGDINQATELKSLLAESMKVARLVMNAEASSLILLNQDDGDLYISLPTGLIKDKIKGRQLLQNAGMDGWVVTHKKPSFLNDVEASEIFWGEVTKGFEVRNIVCVPLISETGKVTGLLHALNRKQNKPFASHDIPVFQTLASHVSMAIDKIREKEDLQNQLKEKEVLFTEIHHRIKNNLATISALIEVERKEIDDADAKQILRNTYSRLQSVTEVHDLLCNKSLIENLELGLYLERLAGKISKILSEPERQVDIQINADPVQISADKTMICGLVLNELLVNIYKHAFKGLNRGDVVIDLVTLREDRVKLSVTDNGIGIPDDFDLKNANSIGTWVVNVLLKKLHAEIEIDRSDGTGFSIEFPG